MEAIASAVILLTAASVLTFICLFVFLGLRRPKFQSPPTARIAGNRMCMVCGGQTAEAEIMPSHEGGPLVVKFRDTEPPQFRRVPFALKAFVCVKCGKVNLFADEGIWGSQTFRVSDISTVKQ